MLVTLLCVISLLSLAIEIRYFVDKSLPCTDFFYGPAWGNVLLWTVVRLITNYVALFYSLYLFWMRRGQEVHRVEEEDTEPESEESMQAMVFRRENNKSETSMELSPRHSLLSHD